MPITIHFLFTLLIGVTFCMEMTFDDHANILFRNSSGNVEAAYVDGLRADGVDVGDLMLRVHILVDALEPLAAYLKSRDQVWRCLRLLESLPNHPNPLESLERDSIKRFFSHSAVPIISLRKAIPMKMQCQLTQHLPLSDGLIQ